MKLESPRTRVFCAQTLFCKTRPDTAASAELGDLFKKADRDIKEKRKPWQEGINIEPSGLTVFGILNGRCQCERHSLSRRRTRLLHMLTHDRYGFLHW